MANSKAISIRVPDELLKKIDRLAEEKYKSHKGTPNRSLVVLDAIAAYFDTLSDTSIVNELVTVSNSVTTVECNELRDIVTALSDSVRQLKDKLLAVSDSVNKLDASVEKKPVDEDLSIGQPDVAVSDTVNKLDASTESKPTNENLLPSQLGITTVSDSVSEKTNNTPDIKPEVDIAAATEVKPEPKLLSLNMEALAKRLKVTEKTLRASVASDESWQKIMASRTDPESLQWARPVKVGKAWRIDSLGAI